MNPRLSCFTLLGLLMVGLLLAAGCQPTELPEQTINGSSSNCGYFEGEVVAAWDSGGRTMTLRQNFDYVDPQNRRWSAPAGSVVDGASIPGAFWTFVGGPFEGQYRNASVVHDVGCNEKSASWQDVHRMFYDACICGGVDPQSAKVLYYAVYHFGPRWEPAVETVIETHKNEHGELVQQKVQHHCLYCSNPTPPTLDEVQQIVELVEEENPAPAVLEETTPEVLRRRPRRRHAEARDRSFEGQARDLAQPTQYRQPADRQSVQQYGRPSNDLRVQVSDQQSARQYDDRRVQTFDQSFESGIGESEKRWISNQVNDYLVKQGQNVPDEYRIERTSEGYWVALRYVERNQRNELIGYAANSPTARVSSNGQVLEIRTRFR